jgi:hypothetical protein
MRLNRRALLLVPIVVVWVGGCSSKPPSPTQTVTQTVTIGTTAQSEAPAPTTTAATARPAPADQEVQDGNLAFKITIVFMEPPAPLMVDVEVRNTGARPAAFDAGYQKLIDNRGREYSVSNASLIGGSGVSGNALVLNLNPGLMDFVDLEFQVPADIQPSLMVFHASADSPGVAVATPKLVRQ